MASFREITYKHNENFYYFNCFHWFRTENKPKKHYNVSENRHCCYVEMPKEDNKILKYSHGEKSLKAPFMIYADLECLLEKMNTCHNYYRGKNGMKNFCLDLREHATKKIIDYEKKRYNAINKWRKKIHREQKVCYICKKDLALITTIKNTIKSEIIVITQ